MNKLLLSAVWTCFYFVLVTPAFAATVNFTGNLGHIYVEDASATYFGTSIGHSFSGSITYGDSDTDASSIDTNTPISADYPFTGFSYGGIFTDGSAIINTIGSNSQVGIGDNDGMGDDTAIILAFRLRPAGSSRYGAEEGGLTDSHHWETHEQMGHSQLARNRSYNESCVFTQSGPKEDL